MKNTLDPYDIHQLQGATHMNLPTSVRAILHKWWLVLICMIIGALAGLGLHASASKTYSATATAYLGVQNVKDVTDLSTGQAYVLNQMESFASIVTSPSVLTAAAQDTGTTKSADDIADDVATSVSATSTVMQISVKDADPAKAAAMANSVAKHFNEQLQTLTRAQTNGRATVAATTITPATRPVLPSGSSAAQEAFLGLLAGLALGCIAALVWQSNPSDSPRPRRRHHPGSSAAA